MINDKNLLTPPAEELLAKMTTETFNSTELSDLPKACFDHLIPLIRGKSGAIKNDVYSRLTQGQQALFMFKIYYDHALDSCSEFYWWNAYYMAQPPIWEGIKSRISLSDADEMLALLEKMETVLKQYEHPRSFEKFDASLQDLEKLPELREAIEPIHEDFKEISSEVLSKIGSYIRSHPEQFIRF